MSEQEFRELVGQAVGEASVCWSELPAGVFQSEKASAIVDRIFAAAIKLKLSELEKS